jgi:hypothetical protein
MRSLVRLTALAVVLVLAPAAVAHVGKPGVFKQQTASAAGRSATLSWNEQKDQYGLITAADVMISISRAGTVVLSAAVPEQGHANGSNQPFTYPTGKALGFHRLDLSSDPELLVNLYTGGAHCCEWTLVYRYDTAANTYVSKEIDWGNPGYRLVTLAARELFQTGDDSFSYRFTDYADSVDPARLIAYTAGKFTDVTPRYPAFIAKDAKRNWSGFQAAHSRGTEVRGLVAAWMADEFLLGHRSQAIAQLNQLAAAGELNPSPGTSQPATSAAQFVSSLLAFLRKDGYG